MSAARQLPCATCGLCCRSYVVPVCGHDVWSISTREQLAPESFVIAVRQDEPHPDGFRLATSGPTYGLALDKRGQLRANAPCVFLVSLGGGHERCGIYDHRPVVCQAYPMYLLQGAISQRTDALCPSGAWPDDTLAAGPWRPAVQRQRMRFDIYHEVVARWNERIAGSEDKQASLREYLTYLLNAYSRLSRLEGDLGDRALEHAAREWPVGGDEASIALRLAPAGEAPPWAQYYALAREVIDGMYARPTA